MPKLGNFAKSGYNRESQMLEFPEGKRRFNFCPSRCLWRKHFKKLALKYLKQKTVASRWETVPTYLLIKLGVCSLCRICEQKIDRLTHASTLCHVQRLIFIILVQFPILQKFVNTIEPRSAAIHGNL